MFRYTQVATRTWDELSAEAQGSTAVSTGSSTNGDEAGDGLEWLDLWGVERSSVPEWLRSWQEEDQAVKIKIRKVRCHRGEASVGEEGIMPQWWARQHHTYLLLTTDPFCAEDCNLPAPRSSPAPTTEDTWSIDYLFSAPIPG